MGALTALYAGEYERAWTRDRSDRGRASGRSPARRDDCVSTCSSATRNAATGSRRARTRNARPLWPVSSRPGASRPKWALLLAAVEGARASAPPLQAYRGKRSRLAARPAWPFSASARYLAGFHRRRRRALRGSRGGRGPARRLGQPQLFFFLSGRVTIALATEDWCAAERYAAALEDYTRAEPLAWSDFVIARGRALAAWGRGSATLRQLNVCAAYTPTPSEPIYATRLLRSSPRLWLRPEESLSLSHAHPDHRRRSRRRKYLAKGLRESGHSAEVAETAATACCAARSSC